MTEDEKLKIRGARYSFVLKDPYPELTEWATRQIDRSALSTFLFREDPPNITPHKAWNDGFNFAWGLIEKRLNEL